MLYILDMVNFSSMNIRATPNILMDGNEEYSRVNEKLSKKINYIRGPNRLRVE